MTFETNMSLLLCWQSRIEWGWNGSCYQTPATDTRRKNKNSSKLLGFNDCYHMWPICLILCVLFQFNIPVDQRRKLKVLQASHDQWNENTSNCFQYSTNGGEKTFKPCLENLIFSNSLLEPFWNSTTSDMLSCPLLRHLLLLLLLPQGCLYGYGNNEERSLCSELYQFNT